MKLRFLKEKEGEGERERENEKISYIIPLSIGKSWLLYTALFSDYKLLAFPTAPLCFADSTSI